MRQNSEIKDISCSLGTNLSEKCQYFIEMLDKLVYKQFREQTRAKNVHEERSMTKEHQ